jgi:hypothetical protein
VDLVITEPVYHDSAGSTDPRPGPFPYVMVVAETPFVVTNAPRALDEEKQRVSPRWNCPLF